MREDLQFKQTGEWPALAKARAGGPPAGPKTSPETQTCLGQAPTWGGQARMSTGLCYATDWQGQVVAQSLLSAGKRVPAPLRLPEHLAWGLRRAAPQVKVKAAETVPLQEPGSKGRRNSKQDQLCFDPSRQ